MSKRSSSEELEVFKRAVDELVRMTTGMVQNIAREMKLYEAFQVYVYMKLAEGLQRLLNAEITPQNTSGNAFVFKLTTGGRYSSRNTRIRYSYLRLRQRNICFDMLMNIDVTICCNSGLNLDVVLRPCCYESEQIIQDPLRTNEVRLFVECKSARYSNPEMLATVVGQLALLKTDQSPGNHREHCERTVGILAVRGQISRGTDTLLNCAVRSREQDIYAVGMIAPDMNGGDLLVSVVIPHLL